MIIAFIAILLFSIIIHEVSHGWIAYRLGDPTPKLAGRLTLNPLVHFDIFGTVVMPILLLLISGGRFSFGYAKPVPINPYNFKNPKRDILWVGAAGPMSNILLAIFFIWIIKIFAFPTNVAIYQIMVYGVIINLILAIFNLIPIPPLDGSKIVGALLPYKYAYRYFRLETLGFFLIILLIFSGFLQWFVFPIIRFILIFFGIKSMFF